MQQFLPSKTFKAGAVSALVFILLFPFISQFSAVFSLYPLLCIDFQKTSLKEYQIVNVLAALTVFLIMGQSATIFYILLIIGPALIYYRQYVRQVQFFDQQMWYPPGWLLADYLVWCSGGVIVLYFLITQGDIQAGIAAFVARFNQDFNDPQYIQTTFKIKNIFHQLAYYQYGFIFILSSWITCAVFARAQHALVKNNFILRSAMNLTEINLPIWWWIIFFITASAWIMFDKSWPCAVINANIFVIVLNGFFIQGLSIIHNCSSRSKNKQMILVIFYSIMILFTLLILLVTLLGILEPWLQMRQRFSIRKE